MRLRRGIGLLAAGLLLLAPAGCAGSSEDQPLSRSGLFLDTAVTITLYHTRDSALLDACFEQIDKLEQQLSRTVEGSDIWNINHAGGQPVTVSEETAALIRTSLDFAEKTNGALDITIAPASSLWDFHTETPALPDAAALEEAVSHVGWETVECEGNTVRLTDPQAALDLGAVAKGYIADRLADSLREAGVASALIDLGGNIYALGDRDGRPWRIGVRDPDGGEALAATAQVQDGSVVTSGIYERGFDLDGRRYHHILDPQTGWPVDNGLASVTIVCESSFMADALSTSCFVLGEEKGLALVETLDGVEVLFIRRDGTQIRSSGFPDASV